jgi:hypothetical protein
MHWRVNGQYSWEDPLSARGVPLTDSPKSGVPAAFKVNLSPSPSSRACLVNCRSTDTPPGDKDGAMLRDGSLNSRKRAQGWRFSMQARGLRRNIALGPSQYGSLACPGQFVDASSSGELSESHPVSALLVDDHPRDRWSAAESGVDSFRQIRERAAAWRVARARSRCIRPAPPSSPAARH